MKPDIFSKKGLLEFLSNNKEYSACLASIKDEEERRKVKAFTEDVFVNIFKGILNVHKASDLKKREDEKPENIPKK